MDFEQLYSVGLSAMTFLSPEKARLPEHEIMARAFATVVSEQDPIFKDDKDKLRTLSTGIAVAFREGSLRPSVVGDCTESKAGEKCKGRPRSFCSFQVNESMGGDASLNEDPVKCVRVGMKILRTSARICPRFPINWYAAGGEHACEDERATRISNDRMALAKRIYERSRQLSTISRQPDEKAKKDE
jgi:hypothetical protein